MAVTSEEIRNRLWAGANELRGAMDASRYKDYMLGLMFYKFLSDKTLNAFGVVSGMKDKNPNELLEEYTNARQKYGNQLFDTIQKALGYYVAPECLYQSWMKDINEGRFEVQKVTDSFNSFERTIAVGSGSDDFKGLFANSTLDLSDTALGSNLNERSKNIQSLIKLFSDLDMVSLQSGDVLGDAYEYLIGMFAMDSGKKAGEFYTPRRVSTVLAKIVALSSDIRSVYDPCVGSGSLLLTVGKQLSDDAQKNLSYYGQEKNTATYNLTRMNLLLHGVRPEKMTIKNGDTLSQDWPEDPQHPNEGVQFDAVVMNPPYSAKNWNKAGLKVSDPRFDSFGVLPPSGKGDYAFLLHGLYHLGQDKGVMAIVLPHGVLFRGGTEGDIRKRLIEKNNIDTIIGMPNNMFTNTSIPVLVMVLKKNRKTGDPLLIIDASKTYAKEGKQNVLQDKDIARIVDTYANRREISGYSHLADRDEIIRNDYNLNIPRYVDSSDDDIPQDVDGYLFGGIPADNLKELRAINALVPDILDASVREVRAGYVELTRPVSEISSEIMNCEKIEYLKKSINEQLDRYIAKYYEIIRNINITADLQKINEDMLTEIKDMLAADRFVDEYDGYQIIADIWTNSLSNDTEIIKANGFYKAGRMRLPHMVSKGSGDKKRSEQDGWVGAIVLNDLVARLLFAKEQAEIDDKKNVASEAETELSELVEAARGDDTDEANALGDCVKESGDAFDSKLVKDAIKQTEKGSPEYEILKKADGLMSRKSALVKEIKEKEKNFADDVQNRIEQLSDDEIDRIMQEKWFGNIKDNIINLLMSPLEKDIATLEMLNGRYAETMESLDDQIAELEVELHRMMDDMVVTE